MVPGWFPAVDATQAKFVEVVLSSSRRVNKAPGRRPQSAKRRQFLNLLAQGWMLATARREVGIGRRRAIFGVTATRCVSKTAYYGSCHPWTLNHEGNLTAIPL